MLKIQKTGVVVVRPQSKIVKNIGDYIQTLSVIQHLGKIDYYIDREELYSFYEKQNIEIKTIINGCYVWDTKHWPPSNNINPLFISIHIFPFAEEKLFSDENIEYWMKHAPIGCRDLNTLEMFKKRNIAAYFSACTTLTLGEKYSFKGKRYGVYFVDPYIPLPLFKDGASLRKVNMSKIPSALSFYICNRKIVNKLARKNFFSLYGPHWGHSHYKGVKLWFMRHYHALQFYRLYSKKFTDEFLLQAEYITHMYRLRQDKKESDQNLLAVAEDLLKTYAHAKMVVTSRIHSALPCLGLETPVIFALNTKMESDSIKFNTPGRFGGLIDLFRVIRVNDDCIVTNDKILATYKIGINFIFENKQDYKTHIINLKDKIIKFTNTSTSS